MKSLSVCFVSILMSVAIVSCGQTGRKAAAMKPQKDLSKYSQATFASGCFWCVEGVYESVKGVEEAVSGYAGGKEPNPYLRTSECTHGSTCRNGAGLL